MHESILEGTWEEVSRKAASLNGGTRVRLEVIEAKRPNGRMIRHGMFKELGEISEEEFKAAEWRGPAEGES